MICFTPTRRDISKVSAMKQHNLQVWFNAYTYTEMLGENT